MIFLWVDKEGGDAEHIWCHFGRFWVIFIKNHVFQKSFLRFRPCPRTLGNPCGDLGAASPQQIPLLKDIFVGELSLNYICNR